MCVPGNSLEKSTGCYIVSQFDNAVWKCLVVQGSEYKTNWKALARSSLSSPLPFPAFYSHSNCCWIFILKCFFFFNVKLGGIDFSYCTFSESLAEVLEGIWERRRRKRSRREKRRNQILEAPNQILHLTPRRLKFSSLQKWEPVSFFNSWLISDLILYVGSSMLTCQN